LRYIFNGLPQRCYPNPIITEEKQVETIKKLLNENKIEKKDEKTLHSPVKCSLNDHNDLLKQTTCLEKRDFITDSNAKTQNFSQKWHQKQKDYELPPCDSRLWDR